MISGIETVSMAFALHRTTLHIPTVLDTYATTLDASQLKQLGAMLIPDYGNHIDVMCKGTSTEAPECISNIMEFIKQLE